MPTSPSTNYPISSRPGEIDRLLLQASAMAPDTERMLDLIGDIGCGPGGITGLLSQRAGATGRVG